MNSFKLNLITLALLISGCGGGGDNDNDNDSTPTITEAKTVTEAEKNLNALSKFSSINLSINVDSSTKALRKAISNKAGNQKTATVECDNGGTLTGTLSDDEKTLSYSFNNCQKDDATLDGEITLIQSDNNNIELQYNALTYTDPKGTQYMNVTVKVSLNSNNVYTASVNGVINQTLTSGEKNNVSFSNMITTSKETSSESWSTVDGTIAVESKCTTGTYQFETVQKLVDARDGSGLTESGILKLNGATYTFDNPQVTIVAGSETETILQSELETRMTTHDTCDI